MQKFTLRSSHRGYGGGKKAGAAKQKPDEKPVKRSPFDHALREVLRTCAPKARFPRWHTVLDAYCRMFLPKGTARPVQTHIAAVVTPEVVSVLNHKELCEAIAEALKSIADILSQAARTGDRRHRDHPQRYVYVVNYIPGVQRPIAVVVQFDRSGRVVAIHGLLTEAKFKALTRTLQRSLRAPTRERASVIRPPRSSRAA